MCSSSGSVLRRIFVAGGLCVCFVASFCDGASASHGHNIHDTTPGEHRRHRNIPDATQGGHHGGRHRHHTRGADVMALYGDLTEAYFAATTDRYRTPEEENGELNARLQTCLTEKAKWERLAEDWERYGTNAEAKIKSLEAENERLQSIVSDQGARIQAGDFQMQSKDRRIQSYVNDLNKLRMSIDEDRKSFKKLLEESESKNSSLMDRLNASSSNYEKLVSDAENKDEENSRLRSQINELTRENKRLAKANEEQRDLANKQEEKISSLRQKIDKSITAGRSEQLVRELEVLKETVARLAAEIKEGDVDLGDPDLNECIDDFEKMKYFVLSQIEIQNQIHEALLDAFKRQ